MTKFNKGFTPLIAIIIVVAAAVLVGGGVAYYYVIKTRSVVQTQTPIQQVVNQESKQQQNNRQQEVNDKVSAMLNLDYATYEGGCMVKDCKPNYNPTLTKHLNLKVGDKFGTAESYETGNLFQLISFDNNKIVVKLAKYVSPLINHKRITIESDSLFSFSNSACFTLNNWLDIVPNYCLARSSANINLKFDIISNIAP